MNVIPPSETWSQASKVESIAKTNPKQLFIDIDVNKCFKYTGINKLPKTCNQT